MASWVKAGLIGGAVVAVLNLIGIIPLVGVLTCCLGYLAFLGIGALAAHYQPPPRDVGRSAGQGALAAILAAVIGGIVQVIVLVMQSVTLGSADVLSQIPPELLQQLRDAGVDPSFLEASAGPVGAVIGGSMCCVFGIALGAALGAIGGAIWASMRRDY